MNQQARLSNHTETSSQLLSKRAAYVAAHREYFEYLQLLLDRAALPACHVYLSNLTTMAAMFKELLELNPTAPWLNAVVLGRVLNRVLPHLLRWHGTIYMARGISPLVPIQITTSTYRFCELGKARMAFKFFVDDNLSWSNQFDQWQPTSISP